MLSSRQLMDLALKALVVPVLRERGFACAYPYFRRLQTTHVEILTFQFDISGDGFLLEASRCGIGGITTPLGKHIEATKVSPWQLPPDARLRIKPREGASNDTWFRYEHGKYDSVANEVLARLPVAYAFLSIR